MHPFMLDRLMIELQREREKELLNLTEEQNWIRRAKPVKNSNSINVDLYEMIRTIGRNLSRTRKVATITAKAEVCTCASCGALQQQVC